MIFIFCPRANATGGTELLHQLGYKLNQFGFDASMYYYGEDDTRPVTHPHFLKYHVPVAKTVFDQTGNCFVYPEIMVSSLTDIKKQLPLSTHILWWLSVDNAGMTSELEQIISEDNGLIHFVQSYYALDYVKNILSVPADRLFYLSDYLNTDFLNISTDVQREDIVLFNPRKGYERTSELIRNSDYRIKWQALSGLAPEDIPQVLQRAKVYIDFGNHPGKDRFPREAVLCGCRVITGRKGAAANNRDVRIPDDLKVSDDLEDEQILDLIYGLIQNYDRTAVLYDEYRNVISEELHSFEVDSLRVFSALNDKEIDGLLLDSESLGSIIQDEVTKEEYKKALYHLTVYRLKEFDIDEDMMILEGYTRFGLGEEQVTLYLMNKLLSVNDTNYEAHLLRARALLTLGIDGAKESLDKALKYCTGTDDEEYIKDAVKYLED